ncbi:MAG TPA: sugar phosphate nucleotidyltransferase [Tepidisphaeraceae bacterium]|jgi:UTP--glucose-1-phosphate uridylyltransferase|nr:sugar phosphate nucleotidyltransferase [Tepidisphaeraceae bacterium]
MARVLKAVIPAAGRGTRQYPASSAVHKPMFPLVDRDGLAKPVIQIVIEEAIESGIEEICIVTAPGEQSIYRDYFRALDHDAMNSFHDKQWAILESQKLAEIGRRISFAEQTTAEGFGHAVYQAKRFVGDDPFLLLLADHLYISDVKDRCARQLIDLFERNDLQALSGVHLTRESDLHLFGVIEPIRIDADRGVHRAGLIVEKPTIDFARARLCGPGIPVGLYLAHFGMHVFSPQIFDSLEFLISGDIRENGEFQLTAAQEHLRRRTEKYWCMEISGRRYDTGVPAGLIETQLAFALNGVHQNAVRRAIAEISAPPGKF